MQAFSSVKEALEDLRQGKIILVTDDEDRENEGERLGDGEETAILM